MAPEAHTIEMPNIPGIDPSTNMKGAWGFGLFQSDHEYDFVDKWSYAIALDLLEDEAKAKAQKSLKRKSTLGAVNNHDFIEKPEGKIHYRIYGKLCSDIPLIRKLMDAAGLKKILHSLMTRFRGGDPKDGIPPDNIYSPEYSLVMLCACAMSLGCKLPSDFKLLVTRLYRHVNLMPEAVEQMKKALAPGAYTEGVPYDFGSLGLRDTGKTAPKGRLTLNVDGIGTMHEPRVPAEDFSNEVCGTCGADKGEGAKGGMLACGKCKTRKYCSKDCQKIHWKVHKQVCGKAAEELEQKAAEKAKKEASEKVKRDAAEKLRQEAIEKALGQSMQDLKMKKEGGKKSEHPKQEWESLPVEPLD